MKLLKKILCGILSATMLITSAAIPVMADEDIKVKLDGNTLSFDVPPQIINDRTMVPLRAIFEALGASVDWNQQTKTVTSVKGDTTIKLTIDSNTMYVNGNAVTRDTPACVVNDRTLVPVRAISEAYQTKVIWNKDTKTVALSSNFDDYTNSLAFARLSVYIENNGSYVPPTNSYAILEQLSSDTDICLTARMKQDEKQIEAVDIILTTTTPNYISQTILMIKNQPSVITTSKSKYGATFLEGDFLSADCTFRKTGGNEKNKTLEQDSIDIVNNALGFMDNYIQIKTSGKVTLSDFGVAY